MRFVLESSHVVGDFSGGRLAVSVTRPDDEQGISLSTDTYFSVPPDFHTHNDSVAAALMTFAGHRATVVTFNFPISTRCADILRSHYGLDEVGPVDAALAPRAPGNWLAVNFSGGLDSTALVVLLRELLQEPIRVISTDYGGFYAFERRGYANARQDLVSRTDLRDKRLDRVGRFNAAVPLLFADYLDLRALTSGDPFSQELEGMRSLAAGEQPWFLRKSAAYAAGGLEEIWLARGLNTPGLLRILLERAPQLLEAGFAAAAVPGSQKHITKGLILTHLFERDGRELPAYLETLTWPTKPLVFGRDPSADMRLLYIARHRGPDVALRLAPNLDQHALATIADLSLTFQERYNTDFITLLPLELRPAVLDAWHACGIYPWDERDWREVAIVRDLLEGAARRVERRRTTRLT